MSQRRVWVALTPVLLPIGRLRGGSRAVGVASRLASAVMAAKPRRGEGVKVCVDVPQTVLVCGE